MTSVASRVITREVTFRSGDVVLSGTLHLPEGETGLPAVALVHGSGPGPRSGTLAEAEAFASAGIAVLHYDKRTAGYSALSRDYAALAGDALEAVRFLHSLPETDCSRIGLWGFSEGGWVAPLAATLAPEEIAFVVTVGASGRVPCRSEAWSLESYLRRKGLRGSLVRAVTHTGMRQIVAAGIFPEAFYDTVPVLRKVRQPVLAIWGELDRLSPPAESLEVFRSAMSGVTVKIMRGAEHSCRVTTDGYDKGSFAPGYIGMVTTWIKDRPSLTPDDAPVQEVRSSPLQKPAWWESGPVQAGVIGTITAAYAGHLVCSFAGRGRRSGRVAALLGSSAVGGWITYLYKLTTTENPRVGPLAAGRTVPWTALQGAAATTVAATVVASKDLRSPKRSVRIGARLLLAGTALFVPWAIYWGLLQP